MTPTASRPVQRYAVFCQNLLLGRSDVHRQAVVHEGLVVGDQQPSRAMAVLDANRGVIQATVTHAQVLECDVAVRGEESLESVRASR